jgi:GT2 family glycosyltransferase
MSAPVSAILPTWKRLDDLPKTLRRLQTCTPPPSEIIVHIDAGDNETGAWLAEHHPDIRVLKSTERQGPGGGRNRLLNAVSQPFAASFDDDSYPIDDDYFDRLIDAFDRHSEAGMLSSVVVHRGETTPPAEPRSEEVVDFIGCGCAYRMAAWQHVHGYLPRAVPYGIEEIDMGLQMIDAGWSIIHDYRLRVFHDTDLEHRIHPDKTAGAIENRALLAYVRYPVSYMWMGILQYLRRILWSLRSGRADGVLQGILQTPSTLRAFSDFRKPVQPATLRKAFQLRSHT